VKETWVLQSTYSRVHFTLWYHYQRELVVDSPDTDVLILLIEVYQRLPAVTSFLTGRRNLRRNIAVQPICEKLGEKGTSTMIDFYVFTGSDMSGRFAGRSLDCCFKVFLKCDSKILDALGALGQEPDHLQKYLLSWNDSTVWSISLEYLW